MDYEGYISELDKIPFPTINYRQNLNMGLSTVNFFAWAMGLYMMSAPMMGWIDYETPTLGTAYMFGGICNYLIGFYDWYQGRTMISFIDFVYGLLHLVYYYTADLGKYGIWVPSEYYTYMQGVFYCLWLAMLLVVLVSLGNRGYIYKCIIFLLALGTIFLLIWEFAQKTWPRKTAGYIIFIASIYIWYAGLARLISNVYVNDCLPSAQPYW